MHIVGLEVVEYLIGGFMYLFSSRYREYKNKRWSNQSSMYKIYEVGMWIAIPIICGLVVLVVTVI